MQEVFQTGGDTDWSGVLDAIAATCDWCPVPVIVKEVGFGLDPVSAEQLLDAGVSLLDVAGRGGTRFDRIEQQLAHPEGATPEEVFADWGLTTVESLRAIKAVRSNAPLVASGGIRNGLDLAKSLCLGAQAGGIAGAVLQDALISTDAVVATLSRFTDDLKIACFGAGVGSVSEWGAQHIEDIA
jgi:L-lactate dehydrogenase (FMN-dependent) and related alpha-hydroxy acid dehydrogenases